MLPPVRCFSCGLPIGDVAPEFRRLMNKRLFENINCDTKQVTADINRNIVASDILDSLGIITDCCRMHLITGMDWRDYY